MSMGYNDDPSLGQLLRSLEARIARALQHSIRGRNPTYHRRLEQLQLKLEAWTQIIGYKSDVLEHVERDDPELAASTRQSFTVLLADMDHVEVKLGIINCPSDGSQPRDLPISHLEGNFEMLLMNRTKAFTSHEERNNTISTRPKSINQYSNAQPARSYSDHSRQYSRSSQPYYQPQAIQSSHVPRPASTNRHRSSHSVHSLSKPASVRPQYNSTQSDRRRHSPTHSSRSSPTETIIDSPIVPFAGSPNANTTRPFIPQRLPSIAPLLASTENRDVQQTPSTTTASAHSSPLTPACNTWAPQYQISQSPTVNSGSSTQETYRLAPLEYHQSYYTNHLRALEPRFDNFPNPGHHIDSFRRPSTEWLAANGRFSWNRRSGLF